MTNMVQENDTGEISHINIEEYINENIFSPFKHILRFKEFLQQSGINVEYILSNISLYLNDGEYCKEIYSIKPRADGTIDLNPDPGNKSNTDNTQRFVTPLNADFKDKKEQKSLQNNTLNVGKVVFQPYTDSEKSTELSSTNKTLEEFEKDIITKIESMKDVEAFKTIFRKLVIECGMNCLEIYTEAQISKEFFYKILNGHRMPGKDTIIRLSFAIHLTTEVTNNLLTRLGYTLCSNSKRDFIISSGLDFGIKLDDIDIILEKYGEKPLLS